jgi:hypothetical protein
MLTEQQERYDGLSDVEKGQKVGKRCKKRIGLLRTLLELLKMKTSMLEKNRSLFDDIIMKPKKTKKKGKK